MGYVTPPGMRSTVRQEASGLTIEIPVKRNWFMLVFLSLWLCGWLAGAIMVPGSFFSPGTPAGARLFTVAWLAMWTVGGVCAIYIWLWQVAGMEIIRITHTSLTRRRALFRVGRDKEFGLSHIRNLRVATPQGFNPFDFASAGQFWGLSGGAVAFDYGARTYRFGLGLDEAEAKTIVQKIREHVRLPEARDLT